MARRHWHILFTLPNGQKVISQNHASKRDAIKCAEIEGAKEYTVEMTTYVVRQIGNGKEK